MGGEFKIKAGREGEFKIKAGREGNGETKLDPPRLSPLSPRRGSGRPLVNWTIQQATISKLVNLNGSQRPTLEYTELWKESMPAFCKLCPQETGPSW